MAGQNANMDQFEAYFKRADLDGDGRISGLEAVGFFQGSGLPKQVLAQIWMYADQSRTGFLGRQEFFNALKLVTVAQSKRELTPDIINAALHGPAAAKIPAPRINLQATPAHQLNTSPAASAPQMGLGAPVSSQNFGFRGPGVPNTNQNYAPSQQSQSMGLPQGMPASSPRPPQGMPVVNTPRPLQGMPGASTPRPNQGMQVVSGPRPPLTAGAQEYRPPALGPYQGIPAGIASRPPQTMHASAAVPSRPNTNISSDWFGGSPSGSPTVPGGSNLLPPSTVSKPQPPVSMPLQATANDSKALVVSGNGLTSSSGSGGDLFSSFSFQQNQGSSVPGSSTSSTTASSAIVQASSTSQPPAKRNPLDSLQNTYAMPHTGSQIQQNRPSVGLGQHVLAQGSTPPASLGISHGLANSTSGNSQLSWPKMKPTDVQKYTKVFMEVDTDKDGKITGEQARNLFLSWRLPREVLKQVWDLSDQDSDSMLSLREFCFALYLMERFREGRPLPAALPSNVMFDETLLSMTGPPRASHGHAEWGSSSGFGQQPGMVAGQHRGMVPGQQQGMVPGQQQGMAPGQHQQHGMVPGQQQQHGMVPGQQQQHGMVPGQQQQGMVPGQYQGMFAGQQKNMVAGQISSVTNMRPPVPGASPHFDSGLVSNQKKAGAPVLDDSFSNEVNGGEQHSVSSELQQATTEGNKVAEMEYVVLDSREKMEFYRTKMQDIVLYRSRCENRLNEITERASSDKREAELLGKKYEERYKQVAEIASKLTIEEAKFREVQERKTELHQAIVNMQQGGSSDGILQVRADRIQSDLEELMKALTERCKKHGLDIKPKALIELPTGWQPGIQEDSALWNEDWDKFEDEGFGNELTFDKTKQDSPTEQKENGSPNGGLSPDSLFHQDEKPGHISPTEDHFHEREFSFTQSDDESRSPRDSPATRAAAETASPVYSDIYHEKEAETDADAHRSFDESNWGAFGNDDDIDSVWGFDPSKGKDPDFSVRGGDSPNSESTFQRKGNYAFDESVPGTPLSRFENSPTRFSEASRDNFDSFSRFDSFTTPDTGFSPQPDKLTRFDSMSSTKDFGGAFSRFDSMNSTRDFGGDINSSKDFGGEKLSRFDSINSTRDFGDSQSYSFDDADPFGSSGPFKVSSEDKSPKKDSDRWGAF